MKQGRRAAMTLKAPTFANPEVIEMFVAPRSGAPATDKLVICTGIAILDPPFGSNIDEIRRDTLVFTIPAEHAEDGQTPFRVAPGHVVHAAATVTLADIGPTSVGGQLAVDRVELTFSDPEEGLIFVNADLVTQNNGHILRVGYEVNLVVRFD